MSAWQSWSLVSDEMRSVCDKSFAYAGLTRAHCNMRAGKPARHIRRSIHPMHQIQCDCGDDVVVYIYVAKQVVSVCYTDLDVPNPVSYNCFGEMRSICDKSFTYARLERASCGTRAGACNTCTNIRSHHAPILVSTHVDGLFRVPVDQLTSPVDP